MLGRFAIAALVEIAYAFFTRIWLRAHYSGVELELLKTGCRAIAAIAFFLLFRNLLVWRTPNTKAIQHPLLLTALFISLAIPVLVGSFEADLSTQVVFALTSFVVGLKEEILYRGALQTAIARNQGPWVALLVSNVIFAIYHYGAQPFTVGNVVEWFVTGVMLGTLYFATRSLILVIAIHGLFDALWCLGPFFAMPRSWGPYLELPVLLVCIAWAVRSNNALQGDAPALRAGVPSPAPRARRA